MNNILDQEVIETWYKGFHLKVKFRDAKCLLQADIEVQLSLGARESKTTITCSSTRTIFRIKMAQN